MNLFNIFLQRATKQPYHPLIVTATEIHTYRDFKVQIEQLVVHLKSEGVKRGQCIGLHHTNSPNYIRLTYAIWGCGACVVPIPVELSPSEKAEIFKHIHIDAVISNVDIIADLGIVVQGCTSVSISEKVLLVKIKQLCTHPPEFLSVNAAFIRFSSGTTGEAKGVVLSHETIYDRIHAANQGLKLTSDDRVLWLLSMAYHFAVSIVAYLSFGVTILLCPNTFGITILKMAVKYQATIIYAAPIHYSLMVSARSEQKLSNIRLAIVTTAALTQEIAIAFYSRFQIPLNETYGIIEVGLPCINLQQPLEKQGSVGKTLPDYEIQLEQTGNENGVGNIVIRGKGLVDAYYNPWQPRVKILQRCQGWFATGDIGEIDEDGYLFIRGRSKEVINVGGMKFFPQEVESVLTSHPGVMEACVFSYPDKRLGEVPSAHLVKAPKFPHFPGEDELQDFCRKQLAQHKIPKTFKFVNHLIRTPTGKVIRNYSKLLSKEAIKP